MRQGRRALWAVLAVALALRLGAFSLAVGRDPACMLEPDSPTYEGPAQALLAHGRFARVPETPETPELHRTPGYPLFIAGVYALAGPNHIALGLAQIALSLVPIIVVHRLGRRVWNQRAGRCAALLLALDPISLITAGLILSETAFTAVLALAMLSGVRLLEAQHAAQLRAWLFGLLLALAALVRPLAYYLIFPVVAGVVIAQQRVHGRWSRSLFVVLAVLAPWLLLVGGWQARNYYVAGSPEFSLIANLDLFLYRAAGVVALQEGESLEEAQARLLGELPEGEKLSEAERSAWYGRRAREILLAHPVAALRMTLSGAGRMLVGPGLALAREYFSLGTRRLARAVGFGLAGFTLVHLGVVYAGIALALWGLRRKTPDGWVHALLVGTVLYFIALSSGPETYARFRAPIMPLFCLYAGAGWQQLGSRRSADTSD
ncbi:glycosyltransferase family 39 protein [bacterium]|nr:glycosyltransferase family 39 protein [bacterium]